jgi:hypothetical protein
VVVAAAAAVAEKIIEKESDETMIWNKISKESNIHSN